MAIAGFVEIQRHALKDICHLELVEISNVGRYPDGLLEYESLVLEGRKPAGMAAPP